MINLLLTPRVFWSGKSTSFSPLADALTSAFDARPFSGDHDDLMSDLATMPTDGMVMDLRDFAEPISLIGQVRRSAGPAAEMVIIALTDNTSEVRTRCIDAGADDAISADTDPEEIVARLRAVIRRKAGSSTNSLQVGPITLDLGAGRVTVNETPIRLTRQEQQLLGTLMRRPNMLVSKESLMQALYPNPDDAAHMKIVDMLVCKIRKKLREAGVPETHLETVWGQGYRIVAEPVLAA